jgi:hypothetical protein
MSATSTRWWRSLLARTPLLRYNYDSIASGNEVMKHGVTRDKIAQDEGLICFEMEAARLMDQCVGEDDRVSEFYRAYVKEVQEIIKRNARLEFEAIWREHEETGIPGSTLSDLLSVAITKLDEELQKTDLWHNNGLEQSVLEGALPRLFLDKVGLETMMDRVGLGGDR